MAITGVVISKSGQPVPRATVTLRSGQNRVTSVVANDTGGFTLPATSLGDNILISSVGYQTKAFTIPDRNDSFYYMDPDIREENNVVVTSGKKSGGWFLAVLLIAALSK
jgi:hypothetical protein